MPVKVKWKIKRNLPPRDFGAVTTEEDVLAKTWIRKGHCDLVNHDDDSDVRTRADIWPDEFAEIDAPPPPPEVAEDPPPPGGDGDDPPPTDDPDALGGTAGPAPVTTADVEGPPNDKRVKKPGSRK